MNIQIFGTKKCNDTKKAQRYFKERGIKFQFIDMSEKEISKGEFRSICQAVGGVEAMINVNCKRKPTGAQLQTLIDMIEGKGEANPSLDDMWESFRWACEADRIIKNKIKSEG